MEYTVKITEHAQGQMREIFRYISLNLQAPETALRLLDTLEAEIASLSRFPGRVAPTDEDPWHSYGIHKLPVRNYLVYFWIDEAACKKQFFCFQNFPLDSTMFLLYTVLILSEHLFIM